MKSLIAFLGRALLSIIFISSGINIILDWQNTHQFFIQNLSDWLALNVGNATLQSAIEFGMAHGSLLLLLGVIFQIVGGLLVFLGLWVRLGAFLLIIFLILATPTFHHFWQIQEPDRQMQMINFMKNVSIMGGLFILLALGKGSKCVKKDEKEV
ncbi:MAG: DoxX family protein [Rhabdochlamydiaceae bacterium]